MANDPSSNRIIVVSNRLPLVLSRAGDGDWQATPGRGGLVVALAPVLSQRGGIWVGWPGTGEEDTAQQEHALDEFSSDCGYAYKAVMLTPQEVAGFYYGFSNEILWPLFHDLFDRCVYEPSYWRAYREVNEKYASATAAVSRGDDLIWVQDYHLMLMASELRKKRVTARLGFFLHIPFPSPDIFSRLPWRSEILAGLLDFDLIGLQALRDTRSFIECVRAMFGEVRVHESGPIFELEIPSPPGGGGPRRVRVGTFPISLDFKELSDYVETQGVREAAERLRGELHGRQMILGLDRLDYSKGLLCRLEGYRTALRQYPELHGRVVLSQHMVPSRVDIPEYRRLLTEFERLVAEINGEFSQPGWIPVHYFHHGLSRDELVAYNRVAHMVLITSLKDGMNLVAKEYCSARNDEDGVVILSEFAGAAAEMQDGALLVNPYDYEGIARCIHRAVSMPEPERKARMRRLRQQIRDHDIFQWADVFLRAAAGADLGTLPPVPDYVPRYEGDR